MGGEHEILQSLYQLMINLTLKVANFHSDFAKNLNSSIFEEIHSTWETSKLVANHALTQRSAQVETTQSLKELLRGTR